MRQRPVIAVALATTLFTALTGGASGMLNPLLADLQSLSIACEADPSTGVDATALCGAMAGRLSAGLRVPVHVRETGQLPLNEAAEPSENHAWLKVRVTGGAGTMAARLEWGSAMNMAGAGQNRGNKTLTINGTERRSGPDIDALIAVTPFNPN